MECIRPEANRNVGTEKERANAIVDGAMCALDRTELIGGISTGRTNGVFKFREESFGFRVLAEFARLVQVNIFIGTTRREVRQEVSKPFDRASFGDTGITVMHASEVIRDKDPTSFAIVPEVIDFARII